MLIYMYVQKEQIGNFEPGTRNNVAPHVPYVGNQVSSCGVCNVLMSIGYDNSHVLLKCVGY